MENFIFEGTLSDLSLCDRLIEYYNSAEHTVGKTNGIVDTAVKDSSDCQLPLTPLRFEYFDALQEIVAQYIEKFPACNMFGAWTNYGDTNIQHYAPGQGYKAWHTERASCNPAVVNRHLVFMTYLNDVTDQGGTEFMHQKLIIPATKGKTLIWPADWTYTHRGVVSPTQDKYIVTGWFNYV